MMILILTGELLLAALAVPLMLRRVPPNLIYGYRTRATLSDTTVWYEANAHFGRGMFAASLLSAVITLAFPRLAPPLLAAIAAVTTLIAALITARFIRRYRSGQ
jgi:uncharacterized membrane protein